MNWVYYLIEANFYLVTCYAFFHFFLKNENFYCINRWYLIITPFLSFLLPFMTVNYLAPARFAAESDYITILPVSLMQAATNHLIVKDDLVSTSSFAVGDVLLIIYGLVVLFFVSRMGFEIFKIIKLFRSLPKEKRGKITYLVLETNNSDAFSFFNWLFLDASLYRNRPVIVHEMSHIKGGHSFDILFFELFRCFNWFNPVCYLLFKSAKLNHEYMADRKVVRTVNKFHYASLLIRFAYNPSHYLVHSAFSITQIEQRIKRLGQSKSGWRTVAKYLVIFPLLAFMAFVAAFKVDKSYGFINLNLASPTIHTAASISELSTYKPIHSLSTKSTAIVPRNNPIKELETKLATREVETQLSELVLGETTLSRIAKAHGGRLYAIDYLLHWTINNGDQKIRKPVHSISIGTEAQLFRGELADTLYVDKGFYSYEKGTITVNTDNILIGHQEGSTAKDKKLIVVDAFTQKVLHEINHVDIRTKAMINSVIDNPDYGYSRQDDPNPIPSGYVDVKTRDAGRKLTTVTSNNWIRMARITANQIFTNETKIPQDDPGQTGIIW